MFAAGFPMWWFSHGPCGRKAFHWWEVMRRAAELDYHTSQTSQKAYWKELGHSSFLSLYTSSKHHLFEKCVRWDVAVSLQFCGVSVWCRHTFFLYSIFILSPLKGRHLTTVFQYEMMSTMLTSSASSLILHALVEMISAVAIYDSFDKISVAVCETESEGGHVSSLVVFRLCQLLVMKQHHLHQDKASVFASSSEYQREKLKEGYQKQSLVQSSLIIEIWQEEEKIFDVDVSCLSTCHVWLMEMENNLHSLLSHGLRWKEVETNTLDMAGYLTLCVRPGKICTIVFWKRKYCLTWPNTYLFLGKGFRVCPLWGCWCLSSDKHDQLRSVVFVQPDMGTEGCEIKLPTADFIEELDLWNSLRKFGKPKTKQNSNNHSLNLRIRTCCFKKKSKPWA